MGSSGKSSMIQQIYTKKVYCCFYTLLERGKEIPEIYHCDLGSKQTLHEYFGKVSVSLC
jgi:hypothetical protein